MVRNGILRFSTSRKSSWIQWRKIGNADNHVQRLRIVHQRCYKTVRMHFGNILLLFFLLLKAVVFAVSFELKVNFLFLVDGSCIRPVDVRALTVILIMMTSVRFGAIAPGDTPPLLNTHVTSSYNVLFQRNASTWSFAFTYSTVWNTSTTRL